MNSRIVSFFDYSMMRHFYTLLYFLGVLNHRFVFTSGLREWSPWSRETECSVTCGQGLKYQNRYCRVVQQEGLNTSQNSFVQDSCRGSRVKATPCFKYSCLNDKARCNCGCILTNGEGHIRSRVKQETVIRCLWTIIGSQNTRVRIRIDKFFGGTLYTSTPNLRDNELIGNKRRSVKLPITYTSSVNMLNLTIYYHEATHPKDGIEMEAFYDEIKDPDLLTSDSSPSYVAVIAISICGVIIVIAIVVILYRRCTHRYFEKAGVEEGDDNYSSASSSHSSKVKQRVQASEDNSVSLLGSEKRLSIERGDNPLLMRGFPDGREVFIPTTPKSQESYGTHQLMWPTHMQSDERGMRQALLQPNIGMMIKQGALPFSPQGSIIMPPQARTLEKMNGSEKGYYPNNACDG